MRRLVAPLLLTAVAPAVHADAFLKGPYLQSVTTTGITIMWQSDATIACSIALRSPGVPDRAAAAPAAQLHEVRIDGLASGRRYQYVVECGAERSGGELLTAPDATQPFSFVVFGDTRSLADLHRGVVERVRSEVPDFLLHTGDIVDDGAREEDWAEFFRIERDLLRDDVLYPAVGNHDRQGAARRADAYRRYFALPSDSPDPERYYEFTYANSRFFVLDSNENSFALTDQTAWLERELSKASADPQIAHRFIVMHHPPFSTSLHGGQPELREMWTPIFERYGVDAVFSGHDHAYERAERNGIRYFVTGGGGAPLYPRVPRPSSEDAQAEIFFERTNHYLRVQVVGQLVEVSAIREDGTLIEAMSWGKLPEHLTVAQPPTVQPVRTVTAGVAPVPTPAPTRKPDAPRDGGGGCQTGTGTGSGAGAGTLLLLGLLIYRKLKRPRPCGVRSIGSLTDTTAVSS